MTRQVDVDAAALEVSRCRTLLAMAGERMDNACSEIEAGDCWLYTERALQAHLDALDVALGFEPRQGEPPS